MSEKEQIKLQHWWAEELRAITRKVIAEEEKRQNRIKAKNASVLAEYTSRDDILEAYGFGSITEKKMEKLLDMWDEVESAGYHDNLYEMKIELLQELYQQSQMVLRDMGQEV